VFVLAINGAMEVWITYRGIKSSLNDGMSEKAEATAKHIEQSMSDLERQISWATRAYSYTPELRRADYLQLLRQVPQVSQLTLLSSRGREALRVNRQTVTEGSKVE
jgi:adenylate cyclase